MSVRPWKAPSKAITAGRFVYYLANLTAFSTASAPELKNPARTSPEMGVIAAEALGERDVVLVRDDREVGVREERSLLLRGLDDPRVRVADRQAADAAREVEEGVPVEVGEERAAPLGDDERQVDRERLRDRARVRGRGRPATCGPGKFGLQLDGGR